MVALPVNRIRVWINTQDGTDPESTDVRIRHVDRLTAERTMTQMGMGTDQGLAIHMQTAWAWAALKREGIYTGPFDRFMAVDCLDLEDAGEEDVDPTEPGPITDSPSLSLSQSPEPELTTG